MILGDEVDAQRVLKQMRTNLREQTPARRVASTERTAWKTMIQAVEQVIGRRWKEMTANYGDTGRDALLAVATRHLGWRLSEVVREVPGLSYAAAAQGIRRFWARCAEDKKSMTVASALQRHMAINRI
ncbi:MAG: hypothetical protein RIS76_1891 [Verrucomicrobiota bacterium]